MTTTTKAVKTTKVTKQDDKSFLEAREKELRRDNKHILPGSIRRDATGHHAGKITVEIKCSTPRCGEIRRVATSDLFQVKFCADCTKENRNKRRRELTGKNVTGQQAKNAAKKAAKAKAKATKKEVKKAPKTIKTVKPAHEDVVVPTVSEATAGTAQEAPATAPAESAPAQSQEVVVPELAGV